MPQHKSAKKRLKTSAKRQERNRAMRSTLKTNIKAVDEMPKDEAVPQLQSVVDKATNKGIMHRNKAARLKSRFARTGGAKCLLVYCQSS